MLFFFFFAHKHRSEYLTSLLSSLHLLQQDVWGQRVRTRKPQKPVCTNIPLFLFQTPPFLFPPIFLFPSQNFPSSPLLACSIPLLVQETHKALHFGFGPRWLKCASGSGLAPPPSICKWSGQRTSNRRGKAGRNAGEGERKPWTEKQHSTLMFKNSWERRLTRF